MLLFARASTASIRDILTRRPLLIQQNLAAIVYRSPVETFKDDAGCEYMSSRAVQVRTFARQRICVFGAQSIEHARSRYPLRAWLRLSACDEVLSKTKGWRFKPIELHHGDCVEFETAWA